MHSLTYSASGTYGVTIEIAPYANQRKHTLGGDMKTEQKNNPWLNQNGKPLSDEMLKRVSKDWEADTWERYLKTTEVGTKEKNIRPRKYDEICENLIESIFYSHEVSDEKNIFLRKQIRKLTPKQKEAIRLHYFKRLTLQQTADELKISIDSVRDRLEGAVKKLGSRYGVNPLGCPKVKGIEESVDQIFEQIDRQYSQGQLTKFERARLWALIEVGGITGGF